MDNLTHTLTGLALSRAGLNRFYTRPALVLVVAANLPDIDVISALGGGVSYLDHHRGITHSLFMLPVLALIPVLLALTISRSRAGLVGAYVLSLIGLGSHLLLDWTNAYAIRLLLPFSGTWFHSDLNSVVDVCIWAVLLLAVLGPLLGRLVSSEIGAKPGSGRGLAIFALSFILVYDYGRFLLHERAVSTLNSRVYDGEPPARVGVFPGAVNPLRWVAWVETGSAAIRYDLDLTTSFDPGAGTKFYKPEMTPAIQAAKATEAFRVMGQFAIYPLFMVSPADEPEGGTRVELRDERFPFLAWALVDRGAHVVRSGFHF